MSPYVPLVSSFVLRKHFATIVSVIKAARSWLGRTNQLIS